MQDRRHEIKFILDDIRINDAEKWLYHSTACHNSFPTRKVNSIYFDDTQYSSLRDNLMGLANRAKLRLRWYSTLEDKECISPKVEMKIREGRVGYKKSSPINTHNYDFLNKNYNKLYEFLYSQLHSHKEFSLDKFFIPTLHVSYDRSYFEAPNGIRITFDRNITFYDPGQNQTPLTANGHKYNRIIMEIKFPPEQKIHIAKLLRSSNLTPQRHSKYVAGLATFGRAIYI
ncbi:MAG: polyphosphate polymerase domain-containing protein [Emcibacteraceae bacterium]|nr:polyphosphate polymerase domain-containing protein [Emcibacteraceae bacterium]MDG1857944.1 polyphosphate polymerase domain-containing protein [Emcibacteraceae bacterium]